MKAAKNRIDTQKKRSFIMVELKIVRGRTLKMTDFLQGDTNTVRYFQCAYVLMICISDLSGKTKITFLIYSNM